MNKKIHLMSVSIIATIVVFTLTVSFPTAIPKAYADFVYGVSPTSGLPGSTVEFSGSGGCTLGGSQVDLYFGGTLVGSTTGFSHSGSVCVGGWDATLIVPNLPPSTYPVIVTLNGSPVVLGVNISPTFTVLSPAQATQNLITSITAMSLPNGVQNSLTATLNKIDPTSPSACGKLGAFTNKVDADLARGSLTADQARLLISQAQAIESAIGCPITS